MVRNATRLFTVEEANGLLNTISPILDKLSERSVKQEMLEEQLEEIMEEVKDDYRTALRPGWEELQVELEENINHINNLNVELGKLGVEIDDPNLGVVNFSSLRGIETVFLSYRLGEETVNHWHHLDEDFDCRRQMQVELDIITQ
ncbi:MAG: DUF2203 domain-containing protein [Dehalococcoidia bacterium]|nr:DUF2203 domain-containing protein [Dehalococcoidia bacterium]|tara:strand:+ start:573 stop:1007 length:435 start_codon:yes stop_codon:yes gene_type:complete